MGPPHDNIPNPGIFVLRLIPDVAAPSIGQPAILLMHAVRRHAVHIGSDCEPRRHAVAVGWVIPAEIVVVVIASAWPIVTAAIARPVVIATRSVGPVWSVGTTMTRSARKAIVDVSTAAETSARPMIISSSRRPMMKAVAYVSTAAKATTATEAAAAATAAAPRVAVIHG